MMPAQTKRSTKELPAVLEQMCAAYVDVVLFGQSDRNKLAALVGLRMIVEKARKGAPR